MSCPRDSRSAYNHVLLPSFSASKSSFLMVCRKHFRDNETNKQRGRRTSAGGCGGLGITHTHRAPWRPRASTGQRAAGARPCSQTERGVQGTGRPTGRGLRGATEPAWRSVMDAPAGTGAGGASNRTERPHPRDLQVCGPILVCGALSTTPAPVPFGDGVREGTLEWGFGDGDREDPQPRGSCGPALAPALRAPGKRDGGRTGQSCTLAARGHGGRYGW